MQTPNTKRDIQARRLRMRLAKDMLKNYGFDILHGGKKCTRPQDLSQRDENNLLWSRDTECAAR
jgi:hypothetical protein